MEVQTGTSPETSSAVDEKKEDFSSSSSSTTSSSSLGPEMIRRYSAMHRRTQRDDEEGSPRQRKQVSRAPQKKQEPEDISLDSKAPTLPKSLRLPVRFDESLMREQYIQHMKTMRNRKLVEIGLNLIFFSAVGLGVYLGLKYFGFFSAAGSVSPILADSPPPSSPSPGE